MRQNKTIVIIVMCIAIVFMSIGYALLSTRLDISGSTAVTSTWKVEFSAIRTLNTKGGATNKVAPTASGTTANFEVDLVLPGDEITYEIDITNYGDIDAEIQSAVYSITGSEAIYVYIDGIKKGTLIGSCEGLDTCPTVTLVLRIGYNSEVSKDPTEKTKDIEITIKVGQYVEGNPTPGGDLIPDLIAPKNYLTTQILKDNNGGFSDKENSTYVNNITPGIDFSAISSDTNGKGLYYTSTNTEDNKTTYYYRGDVDNNFVQFGQDTSGNDLYWRIIRINEDGSVRLIYNGTSTSTTGEDVTIGTSKFNLEYNDNAYVGYMYGGTNQSGENAYKLTHANDNPSTIKGVIDNWYVNNTNLSSLRETHLAEAGFCNDRSVAPSANTWDSNDTALGYAKNRTYYGSYNRLYTNKSPQFACPNADNDLFTTIASSKGNKALTNPIGLITVDEIAYAGGVYGKSNESYYLKTGNWYWTINPFDHDALEASESSIGGHAEVWGVIGDGKLDYDYVDFSGGVRPVINIQSTVELSSELPSGCTWLNGTAACPYIIK